MCVQFIAGERFKVFLGSNIRVESFGSYAGRILPPGSDLIWLVLPFVIARIPVSSPNMRRFLTAYLVYEDGVNTVVAFAGVFAAKTLGF